MMATAAKVTIAEVEQLVEVGELDGDSIHHALGIRETDFSGRAVRKENREADGEESQSLVPST